MLSLPRPLVIDRSLDVGFIPPVPALQIHWTIAASLHPWILPGGEVLLAALPRRFGCRLRRQADDAYHLAILWDSTYRQWFSLHRREILASALDPILAALDAPLPHLLDLPVGPPIHVPLDAA